MSRVDDPGTDELATLERAGDRTVLRYRRRLAHPQQKVWRALTEDDHLAAWFPTAIEGTRSAGFASALFVPGVRGRALRRPDAGLRPSTARISESVG